MGIFGINSVKIGYKTIGGITFEVRVSEREIVMKAMPIRNNIFVLRNILPKLKIDKRLWKDNYEMVIGVKK